jgi:hypothetical protein
MTILLSAPRYALAEATSVSGSAARAVIERPSCASRTDTSACASLPSVTRLDAVEHRVDRTVALGLLDLGLAINIELHGGALRAMGARDHRQRGQLDAVMRVGDLLIVARS